MCFSSSPPRASSSPVFFKALAVSCFRRQLQSLPPTSGAGEKDQQQVNMTEVCSLSYTLPPLVHPLLLPPSPPPPPGENTSLTSPLARKSYLSCGRRCRYSLILDGCFQVLRLTTSPRSFKRSRLETTSTKKCSSPGELAVISLMCL